MQYKQALVCFERARALDAKSAMALLGCSQALAGLSRHDEARGCLQRANLLNIKRPNELMQLAVAYRELGDMHAAMEVFEELSASHPEFTQGSYSKALTAMQMGDSGLAMQAIEQTLRLDPSHAQALLLMAESATFESAEDERIGLLTAALQVTPEGTSDRAYILNAMAKVKGKLGDHSAAFEYYRQANDLRSTLREYDAAGALGSMDSIMQAYTPEVMLPRDADQGITPVFIVGLPRCGSTLVEQILIAHSQVSGRGEIDALVSVLREHVACQGDPDIAALALMPAVQCADVGNDYLKRLLESGEESPFIVDKSLNNFLYLGVIARSIPNARIVHVRRHPLDVCLSIYTSNLQGSLFDYGLKLETMGTYCLKYLELMHHWRKVLPAGMMYELDYEQLVADQEGETRSLLAACGLPWEEECLQFQKARQRVNTASILQVRQSMYSKSVARWKPYEKELAPLIEILSTDYPARD